MAQKSSNKKNPTAPTCTQSEESGKFRKLLNSSTSSEVKETTEKVENFDWVPLKHGPFYAVGKKSRKTWQSQKHSEARDSALETK